MMQAKIRNERLDDFILAGDAIFTIRNLATGNRFTYRVSSPANPTAAVPIWFVKVLVGPDNDSSYQYLGTIRRCGETLAYAIGRKSRITNTAMSHKAFDWFIRNRKKLPVAVEVWHEGRCCRCGRRLTVPESIESGIGPECAKMVGVA